MLADNLMVIDERVLRDFVQSLTIAEHPGDVNNTLIFYAPKLGLPKPEWNDELESLVWPWEDLEKQLKELEDS